MSFPQEISFIVSQNDKGDNPARPDYRGEVIIGAQTYELAAWQRVKKGTTKQFMSGKLTLKEPKADPGAYRPAEGATPSPRPARATPSPKVDDDDDIPF